MPSVGTELAYAADVTPGIAASLSGIFLLHAYDAHRLFHLCIGNIDAQGLHLGRSPETGLDVITSSFRGRRSGWKRACSKSFTLNPGGGWNFVNSMWIMRPTSAFACCTVTPGFRRAMPRKL